jgi:hypothetical protein
MQSMNSFFRVLENTEDLVDFVYGEAGSGTSDLVLCGVSLLLQVLTECLSGLWAHQGYIRQQIKYHTCQFDISLSLSLDKRSEYWVDLGREGLG